MEAVAGSPCHRGEVLAAAALAAGLAGYLALLTEFGRFSGVDETVYKAAGREWAATGRFAAPELTGWVLAGRRVMPPPEEIWALQSPLYPFAFGLFARGAGFGWRQCVLFDALIHCVLAVLTWRTACTFVPPLPRWAVPLVGLAVLPLGTPGKPDELALCFAMGGLLALRGSAVGLRHAAVSGILFGLCAATHALAAAVVGLIALTQLATCAELPVRRGALGLAWAACAAVTLAACIAPLLLARPDAFRQYQTHAGVFAVLPRGLAGLLGAWTFGKWYIVPTLAWLAVGVASRLPGAGRPLDRQWVRLWLGPLCGVAFLLAFFPIKHYYLWFVGPWLLAAGAVAVAASVADRRPGLTSLLAALLGLGFAAGAYPWAKDTLIVLSLPESQRLARNAAEVRGIIPAGSTVVADDYWWALAGSCKVYDPHYAHPENLDEIDYVVLVGNGTGEPGLPRPVPPRWAAYVGRNFTPVHDNLNRAPFTLCGVRLTNSAYGFGALVLARSRNAARRADGASPGTAGGWRPRCRRPG